MTLEVGIVAASQAILFLAAVCVALPSRMLYPATAGWLGKVRPATRANILLAWAVAPFLTALVMLLLIFSPSLGHLLGFGVDHCHSHGHHAHLCLVHTPFFTGSLLELLILACTGVAVLAEAFRTGRRLHLGRRSVTMLLALAKPSSGVAPYRIVTSERPFAITAGLMQPQVVVSSRLLDVLSPTELATVVSHTSRPTSNAATASDCSPRRPFRPCTCPRRADSSCNSCIWPSSRPVTKPLRCGPGTGFRWPKRSSR